MSFTAEFIRQIENNPTYLHVGLMCLATIAVGVFTVIITSKTPDDDLTTTNGCGFGAPTLSANLTEAKPDDEDCFSEKQEKSLKQFNKEEITEEFTNYEEEAKEDDSKHPDMILVIRTSYKIGSQLIKDNAVIQFVDFYPAQFVVLREKDLERYQIIDTYESEELPAEEAVEKAEGVGGTSFPTTCWEFGLGERQSLSRTACLPPEEKVEETSEETIIQRRNSL